MSDLGTAGPCASGHAHGVDSGFFHAGNLRADPYGLTNPLGPRNLSSPFRRVSVGFRESATTPRDDRQLSLSRSGIVFLCAHCAPNLCVMERVSSIEQISKKSTRLDRAGFTVSRHKAIVRAAFSIA